MNSARPSRLVVMLISLAVTPSENRRKRERSDSERKAPDLTPRRRTGSTQDAKARLSELVRKAQTQGPQRVSLHGRDSVVVVAAKEFDQMRRPVTGKDIVAALGNSGLADVPFERFSERSPVREIDL